MPSSFLSQHHKQHYYYRRGGTIELAGANHHVLTLPHIHTLSNYSLILFHSLQSSLFTGVLAAASVDETQDDDGDGDAAEQRAHPDEDLRRVR